MQSLGGSAVSRSCTLSSLQLVCPQHSNAPIKPGEVGVQGLVC